MIYILIFTLIAWLLFKLGDISTICCIGFDDIFVGVFTIGITFDLFAIWWLFNLRRLFCGALETDKQLDLFLLILFVICESVLYCLIPNFGNNANIIMRQWLRTEIMRNLSSVAQLGCNVILGLTLMDVYFYYTIDLDSHPPSDFYVLFDIYLWVSFHFSFCLS